MSYITQEGEQSTTAEIATLTKLNALATSGATQAIQKTSSGFANVDIGTSPTPSTFTIKYLVASVTAPAATQAIADYVCDGVADDVQINAALAAVKAAGGGEVELTEGTFTIAAAVSITSSNTTLTGKGQATIIYVRNTANLSGAVTVTGSGVVEVKLRRFTIDGNKSNQSNGDGIEFNTPWTTTDTQHVVEDLYIKNIKNNGIACLTSGDTRVLLFSRVHVKNIDGNGFYFAYPSQTDSNFEDCIADTVALSGFYIGGANNHFLNCKTFYCGSAGGETMGFFLIGYNNYFENCEAQDNYQSGFYGNAAYGDGTYANFGCTFVNCIADSNGQNGGSTYAVGFQGIGVKQWQIIGGIAMTRPYPSFTQRIGISWQSGADQNYVSGIFLFSNTTNYSDTSSGTNVYLPGPGSNDHLSWETIGALDIRHFGATGDCKRYIGVTCSSGSKNVSVSGGGFTQSDVGKTVLCYKEQFYGTITTIATVTNSTSIVLTANAGVTNSGNTYIIYGTDDSTVIQKVLTYAATMARTGSTSDSNQPIGSGRVRVLAPGNAIQSMYMITAQITIPVGVILEADGKIANMLANRNSPCILMQAYTSIDRIELENLGGTGILAGSANSQQQIGFGKVRVWHGIGAQTAGVNNVPTTVAATPSITGGTLPDNTYYYVVTAIDSTGGESWQSAEVNATVSGGTNHGSVALTWDVFTGAASYRIYRGTVTGIENLYFTSVTNSYTDTNASSTTDDPTPPGYALKLIGNEYKIDSLFVKECSTGVFHHSGTDFICDSAFLVGCGTPIRERASNQSTYSHVFLDSCGPSSIYPSMGGVAIDNGCSDISAKIQEFTLSSVSRTLSPVVNIGSRQGTTNKDIKLNIQASNGGGTGLSIAYAQDVDIDMMLSNVVFSSSANNAFTTAVAYGGSITNEIRIRGTYSSGITAFTGTQVGVHEYTQAGITYQYPERFVRSISALRTLDATDQVVLCTSGTFTVTLPTAVSIAGKQYVIKNTGAGTITVGTTSAQTIDGSTTATLDTQYAAITVVSDGANWSIMA